MAKESFDLILLDGNLPDISGFDLCPRLKETYQLPIVFLTARDLEEDQIAGFDSGADDYITKPFSMNVLHRRIKAVLKRSQSDHTAALYQAGFLSIDFEKLQVSRGSGGQAGFFDPVHD